MPKPALLTGITSVRNRGVEALVATIATELRRRRPDFPIAVLGRGSDQDVPRLDALGVRFLPVVKPGSWISRPHPVARVARRLGRAGEKPMRPLQGVISGASVVIASGGDPFSLHYGSVESHLRPIRVALNCGVPVIFLGHSVGPFANRSDERLWAGVAGRARLITVREPITYDYLTAELGLPVSLVHETADPAFLLEPATPAAIEAVRRRFGIDGNGPVIALAPSQAIARHAQVDEEAHLRAWSAAIRMIVDEIQARVLLVPHVQGTGPESDDSLIVGELQARAGQDRRVKVAGALTAAEVKGLIGGCDLLVAERMHAAIAGLSSGVPTLTVSYSRKAEGIVRQVLGNDAGRSLVIRLDRFVEPGCAVEAICSAWTRRHEIRGILDERLPAVRRMAARNFDLQAEVIPA
jgi:colanic acid/amylovoran biosynthesis protein